MSIDLTALKLELTTDPDGRGYAAMTALGDCDGPAKVLNAPGGAVPADAISKDQLLKALQAFTPALLGIADPKVLAFWTETKADLRAANGPFLKADLAPLLSAAIAQKLIPSQAAVDAIWMQAGTVAQVKKIAGAGETVRHQDVARALEAK